MSCLVTHPDLLGCKLKNLQKARRGLRLGRIGIMHLQRNPPTCPTAKIQHFLKQTKKKGTKCQKFLPKGVKKGCKAVKRSACVAMEIGFEDAVSQ